MRGDGYPVTVGKEELGHIATFHASGGEPWGHLGALHTDLALAAQKIADEGILPGFDEGDDMPFACGMTTLDKLFNVGPTHHLIGHSAESNAKDAGAFDLHPITRKVETKGLTRVLWRANAKTQKSMCIAPTHKGTVYDQKTAERIKLKKGTLHYARGMSWASQALLAAVTETKVFGGRAWTTLLHEDPHVCKAFALWANSTLGLVTHWTHGSRTQPGRATTQIKAIKAMPAPNLAELNPDTLQVAASEFDVLSRMLLMPACQSYDDPGRDAIDGVVAEMLGLPVQRTLTVLKTLQEWWCAEPSVNRGD